MKKTYLKFIKLKYNTQLKSFQIIVCFDISLTSDVKYNSKMNIETMRINKDQQYIIYINAVSISLSAESSMG